MIVYKQGNLLADNNNLDIIAHQVNCIGVMGPVVAKQIARKYPEVLKAYKELHKSNKDKLGEVQLVKTNDGQVTIANLFAQDNIQRSKDECVTDYEALRTCLTKLKSFAGNDLRIGMPKIGSGRGGGDWHIISHIINDVFGKTTVTVYILE